MTLRVIGAGVGRTGTLSLKGALETLLGGTCYHMLEVFTHDDHVTMWCDAATGGDVDWAAMLADYNATSDFPACLFWRELSELYPDAPVLLSTRASSQVWWESAHETIFSPMIEAVGAERPDWLAMWRTVSKARFTDQIHDEAAAKTAYDRHNDEVRSSFSPDRLIDWQPGDGWEPICERLGLAVPDTPFPHANTRAEMKAMIAEGPAALDHISDLER
jgi:hypothetical protein